MTLNFAKKYFYFALGSLLLALISEVYTEGQLWNKIDPIYFKTYLKCMNTIEDSQNRSILNCMKVQQLIEI